jgi:hypothetical protein
MSIADAPSLETTPESTGEGLCCVERMAGCCAVSRAAGKCRGCGRGRSTVVLLGPAGRPGARSALRKRSPRVSCTPHLAPCTTAALLVQAEASETVSTRCTVPHAADPALVDSARALRAEFNTTFVMHNEDHTLGNALRMMLNQNPKVSVA